MPDVPNYWNGLSAVWELRVFVRPVGRSRHLLSSIANQVGGARVTAGSGVHRAWPRIEFSVMGGNRPGDPRQLVSQRTDHQIGVTVGRD